MKVKETFKDFNEENNILECEIASVNLYKKENRLEIVLNSTVLLDEEEVKRFISYLKNKFNIEKVDTKINYAEIKNEGLSPKWEKSEKGTVPKNRDEVVESKIIDITAESGLVSIQGEIIRVETKETKNGKLLAIFDLYDKTSTITCKTFLNKEKAEATLELLEKGKCVKLLGTAGYDPFSKDLSVMAKKIMEMTKVEEVVNKRKDLSKEKRVELHMHTKMSSMDAVTSATDLVKRAGEWGMKAIAITDHGVVQAFPEAHAASKKYGVKILYGVEAYLATGKEENEEYSILDIETTGLDCKNDKITEIGIIRIRNGKIISEFEMLVNPEIHIPEKITELTGITDAMVENAETIDKVIPKMLEFIGDTTLVAHNAEFDIGFIRHNVEKMGLKLNNTYIDTLKLARNVYPGLKRYNLGALAEYLNITVDVAHRALDDVKTLVQIFNQMQNANTNIKDMDSFHAIILAKNFVGLKNLYKLVSCAHLEYFYKKPKIPKSLYKEYSEGLILGSACEAGELYRAILEGKPYNEVEEIAKDYDYLEIQPIGNNKFLIRNGNIENDEKLKEINKLIVNLRR